MTTSAHRPPPRTCVHDELGTPAEMAADGREAGRNLAPRGAPRAGRAGRRRARRRASASRTTRAEVGKREIRVSDAAARIANALHLHLD